MTATTAQPSLREIYRYQWGGKDRFADPHKVRRVLHLHLGNSLSETIAIANGKDNPDPQLWFEAWDRLVGSVCAAFGLEPFDPVTGAGAKDDDCRDLLTAFFKWEGEHRNRFPVRG